MQNEVHAKRPTRECAKMANLLPQHWRRAELCLKNAESARVARGSHEFGTREIGPHRRDYYRSLDSKPFAKPRSQHVTIVLLREQNGCDRANDAIATTDRQWFGGGHLILNDRRRRISRVAPRPHEGLLTEPTAGAQPWRRERVLMPPLRTPVPDDGVCKFKLRPPEHQSMAAPRCARA